MARSKSGGLKGPGCRGDQLGLAARRAAAGARCRTAIAAFRPARRFRKVSTPDPSSPSPVSACAMAGEMPTSEHAAPRKHEDELPVDAAAYAEQRERAGLTATDGSALCLAAELEGGGLVGEATLLRFKPRMVRHVGVLGIGVHPEAQGLGVGRALMKRLLGWARRA
ncbi:N-acetyltransferase family protein [Sorangium sp. So ce362]|uniref:GNAT family N-acetyltransferase n=1 Tax=Sorangium sp. So ce362 TaxID=3133303 RepID=UPI003F62B67E